MKLRRSRSVRLIAALLVAPVALTPMLAAPAYAQFGFGGIVDLAWVLVAAAWVGTAGWLIAHRRSRTTGLGMVASVVVVGLVLLIVAGLGALTLQG